MRNRRHATADSNEPDARAAERAAVTQSENGTQFSVRLFDADRSDRSYSFEEALVVRPTERQLLWIDITGDLASADAGQLVDTFGLNAASRRALERPANRPDLGIHGDFIHVRVTAEPDDKEPDASPWLDIVAGKNVVISRHTSRIGFLDDFDRRIETDTSFGRLGAGTFLAALLDATVTSYFRAVDAIEDDVDTLDAQSLRMRSGIDILAALVALRRRIARLRRLLTNQREVFASLGSAHVGKLADDPDSAAALAVASTRFEGAIGAVEDSREILLGSFDVYMTRTAQRTNDVMKTLTVATVLLLPGSLVAGLLGMNVVVPLSKDDPLSFWMVAGGVVIFGLAIIVVARARRWL